ncbi:MAG: ABC transporter permease [Acidobacteria bacterium]|nr:ABC transporter permease [Acidobacteriota bacterium]MBI3487106.1 ABC transporter permease [Acidobacteriota bacterium]
MSNLFLLFRQSLRALLRAPGFTLPIVLVLGLGLGANVALHAILSTVLLRPLPVEDRDSLVLVKEALKGEKALWRMSYPQAEELRDSPGPFAGMATSFNDRDDLILSLGDRRVAASAPLVGPGWFRVLGLRPSLGRAFTAEEEASGAPVMVLSHHLWRTAFHGDPAILGASLRAEGCPVPLTVVGVGPAGFEGLELGQKEDLWLPLASGIQLGGVSRDLLQSRRYPGFLVSARLKPGATRTEAQAALDAASRVLATAPDGGKRFALEGLDASEQKVLNRVLPQRSLLLIASGLALLLAIVGASGLFAARAARREKELATRSALGAGGKQLMAPLLAEALWLAAMAAPVALGSGLFLARSLMLSPGQTVPVGGHLPVLDGRILALGLGLTGLSLLLAALAPLLRARHLDPARVLGSRSHGAGTPAGGGAFVAAQVALSLALLAAASVALGAFRSAARTGYPTAQRAFMTFSTKNDPGLPDRLLARLRAMPEVASAARGVSAPMGSFRFTFGVQGGERTGTENFPGAVVGGDWFRALGVAVIEGREFSDLDGQDKVILNESLARRFFPHGPAAGRMIHFGGKTPVEVVGVVADHRMRPDPDFHLPMLWLTPQWLQMEQCCLLVQGRGNAQALMARMKDALALEKPGAEPSRILTLGDHVAATLHQEHQNMRLLGLLGAGSLLLACFGLWAALNLHVALRRRDMGIRAALGATARHLLASVMGRGLRLLGLGLALGLASVWCSMRLLHLRWPGLPQVEAENLAFSALTLLAAGLVACLLPALRAARVDPAEALRSE